MKPVSYQSPPPPSVSNGHPPLSLERVLGSSNVMYCEKCGFASTDPAAFKKHVIEHLGTRFYCFYCNNVSFSEAELNAHLKQHTSKYPFKCPHCGQGYMRRLCLVKHIERLHSKSHAPGPAKPAVTKAAHGPVSSALPSAPADPPPLRPLVRVTVPPASAPAARLAPGELKGKTLDLNVANVVANGNGLVQHNRALTVSLPEEVTIPAGCLVELVDVKTVNGTKELKLRFVSQQENETVIKDGRAAAPQIKPLASALNHPNTARPASAGMCALGRKPGEAKAAGVERPPVQLAIPKSHGNQVHKDKPAAKRAPPEVINLECHAVPSKVPKNVLNAVRDRNGGIIVTQRDAANHGAPQPTVICTRVAGRPAPPDGPGTHAAQRVADERKGFLADHPKMVSPRKPGDAKNARDAAVAVKLEPGESRLKDKTHAPQTQGARSAPSPSLAAAVRPPAFSVCKEGKPVKPPFPVHAAARRTLNELLPVKTVCSRANSHSKASPWTQEARLNERVAAAVAAAEGEAMEPEGFPVISSVFSLSQQPEDVQGSMQPLVMALRGIVMDKTNGRDHAGAPGRRAHPPTKNGPAPPGGLPTEGVGTSVKLEDYDKRIQHPPPPPPPPPPERNDLQVKEEQKNCTATDARSRSPDLKSPKREEPVPDPAAAAAADPPPTPERSEPDASSKFLTVSLKRVQVGVWRKSKKRLKLRISKYKTRLPLGGVEGGDLIHPMPLKVDQPVKRPGPNQPVVVLNHPKPRAPVQGAGTDAVADPGALEAGPKCQILKMRLSKVMGQKYEVMGCTVGVFP